MLGGPLERSGFPPPAGSFTPPRCGLFLLRRSHDAAVVVGITLGYAAGHASVLPWLGGMAASTGFLLASYATKEYAPSHGAPHPNDRLNSLKRRDLRLFVIACGGLIGYPYHAMVVMGALSHLVIGGILAKGGGGRHRRTPACPGGPMDPRSRQRQRRATGVTRGTQRVPKVS